MSRTFESGLVSQGFSPDTKAGKMNGAKAPFVYAHNSALPVPSYQSRPRALLSFVGKDLQNCFFEQTARFGQSGLHRIAERFAQLR